MRRDTTRQRGQQANEVISPCAFVLRGRLEPIYFFDGHVSSPLNVDLTSAAGMDMERGGWGTTSSFRSWYANEMSLPKKILGFRCRSYGLAMIG